MAKKPKSSAVSNAGNASTTAATRGEQAAAVTAENADAVSLLTQDHRKVEQLFRQFEEEQSPQGKSEVAKNIATELTIHTMLEEQIFYPACRNKGVDGELLNEAQVEHDGAKVLIHELLAYDPEDGYFDAKVGVLSEYIRHHVAEEEKPQEGIFAKARAAGLDMKELGQQLQTRKRELTQRAQAGALPSPPTRSFDLESNVVTQERDMERRYERERDDEGRFVSNERGYRGYSRDQDDDYERGSSGGRGRGWYGDSEGHSEAAQRGAEGRRGSYGSHSGNREDYYDERSSGGGYRSRDDDDNGRSRGRGQGGWSGDPEGHSEASHRGWEERGGYRGGYGSRGGRDYEDERSSGRSSGRGGRGWYGDPEGHSRAAEEGWEHRGGGQRRSSYRGDDDEGSRSRSGRGGHGGWFGDPEGHARAAEEGWESRSGRSSSRSR